jgi:peptidoglycan hydrolase-like protein with peptidoglycan-binding domain
MSFFQAEGADARPTVPGRSDERPPRRSRFRASALIAGLVAAGAAVALGLSTSASADPSANAWHRLRMCESSNNYAINTGNGYYGAYQFDLSTWRSVGGSGHPNQASPTEQDKRALVLYRERGWQPWTCAHILGLKEDADARSGRTSDITFPTSTGAPGWPGTTYSLGMKNAEIAAWQKQLVERGATQLAPGTGQFGPLTIAAVRLIQSQNGISEGDRIGPRTWAAAWTGAFRASGDSGSGQPKPKPITKPKPKPKPRPKPRPVRHSAPAWPKTYFMQGMAGSAIATWQKQMAKRGAIQLTGTGQFGPLTQAVVDRVQRANGIPRSGRIGPLTWAAAWTGKY